MLSKFSKENIFLVLISLKNLELTFGESKDLAYQIGALKSKINDSLNKLKTNELEEYINEYKNIIEDYPGNLLQDLYNYFDKENNIKSKINEIKKIKSKYKNQNLFVKDVHKRMGILNSTKERRLILKNHIFKRVKTLYGHASFDSDDYQSSPISCINFDWKSMQLITGGDDGSLKIWNVMNGRLLITFKLTKEISDVAMNETGDYIAAADTAGNVIVIDLNSKTEVERIEKKMTKINSLKLTNIKSYKNKIGKENQPALIIGGTDNKVIIAFIDCFTKKIVNERNLEIEADEKDEVNVMSLNTFGCLAVGYKSGKLQIFNINSKRHSLILTKDLNKKICHLLEWSPNGKMIIITSLESKGFILTEEANKKYSEIEINGNFLFSAKSGCSNSAAWSANEKFAFISFGGKSKNKNKECSYLMIRNNITNKIFTFPPFNEDKSASNSESDLIHPDMFGFAAHPSLENIVVIGGFKGQLLIVDVEKLSIVQTFVETPVFSHSVGCDVDIHSIIFINEYMFALVTNVGTISIFSPGPSDFYNLTHIEQFLWNEVGSLDENALFNINGYQYTDNDKSMFQLRKEIENELDTKECMEKEFLKNEIEPSIEEGSPEEQKINRNMSNNVDAIEEDNLEEVNENDPEFKVADSEENEEENESDMILEDEKEDSNKSIESNESIEYRPHSRETRNHRRNKNNRRRRANIQRLQLSTIFNPSNQNLNNEFQELSHGPLFEDFLEKREKLSCEFCNENRDIFTMIPFYDTENFQPDKYIQIHKSCLDLNNFIQYNRRAKEYLGIKNFLEKKPLLENQNIKCTKCFRSYPTIKCDQCDKMFHGNYCSKLSGIIDNQNKFICYYCINKICNDEFQKSNESLRKFNFSSSQIEWVNQLQFNYNNNYLPQIKDKVYFIPENYELCVSENPHYYCNGEMEDFAFPWENNRFINKNSHELYEVTNVRFESPSINTYFALKHYFSKMADKNSIVVYVKLMKENNSFEVKLIKSLHSFLILEDYYRLSKESAKQIKDKFIKDSQILTYFNFNKGDLYIYSIEDSIIPIKAITKKAGKFTGPEIIIHYFDIDFPKSSYTGTPLEGKLDKIYTKMIYNNSSFKLFSPSDPKLSVFTEEIKELLNLKYPNEWEEFYEDPFNFKNYYETIPAPSYVKKIFSRISNNYYRSLNSLVDDILRVYENSLVYNASNQNFTSIAMGVVQILLNKVFEQFAIKEIKVEDPLMSSLSQFHEEGILSIKGHPILYISKKRESDRIKKGESKIKILRSSTENTIEEIEPRRSRRLVKNSDS